MQAFISRSVHADSDFARILKSAGWQVSGQSLVHLTPVDFGTPPAADWCFFASKNAVSCWFDRIQAIPQSYRYAALGVGTAAAFTDYGIIPEFVGDGNPVNTAQQFGVLAAGQKVLFPGAVHSQQSIQQALGEVITGLHWPVYENVAIASPPDLRHIDALAFTSPLNVEAYCRCFAVLPTQKVVAIGETTAAALRKIGLEVVVADSPSEQGLAAAILGRGDYKSEKPE